MWRRALALFLLSSGVLLSEVVWTRLFSARAVHVFAFLAVSTALLGTAVGARVAASRVDPAPPGDRDAAWLALAFGLAVPLAQVLSEATGIQLAALRTEASAWLRLAALYVVLALPFACAGASIALLLGRGGAKLPHLYASDLAGAAAGALAALVLLPACAGPPALWVASGLGAAASAVLSRSRVTGVLAGVLVAAGLAQSSLPASVDTSKAPGVDLSRSKTTIWTAHARLDRVGSRWLIDGGVAAVRVPVRAPMGQSDDATLVLALRSGGAVLVVGSGAGWEIDLALRAGARRVVGVEVNPALAAQTPRFLTEDPRVIVVVDDARSYLERSEERFDVILMAHTISNSATVGGALGLTEDHVLTTEALRSALHRLAPDGLLFISRPSAQLPRLASTLAAAAEADLSGRALAWRDRGGGFFGAIAVARNSAFGERSTLVTALQRRRRILEHDPSQRSVLPSLTSQLLSGQPPSTKDDGEPLRWEPATDDRPFFNRRWRLGAALPQLGGHRPTRLLIEERPLAELALLALLAESTLLGLAVALLAGGARGRGTVAGPALVGLAFMAVEISVLGVLGLLVGDPSGAVAVGLAGLLVGAGAGSAVFGSRPPGAAAMAAAVGAGLFALVAGPLVGAALPYPKAVRLALALALASVTGFSLGGALPALLKPRDGAGTAAGWAINGAASVTGLALALLLAPEVGLAGLAGGGAALYFAVALLASPRKRRG